MHASAINTSSPGFKSSIVLAPSTNVFKSPLYLANKIEKQKNIVDTDVAEMYAKYSQEQYENVKDTSNKLDNFANMYFPGNGDEAGDYEAEFAYQRACEAKAVDVMNGVNQSTGSSTSKTK